MGPRQFVLGIPMSSRCFVLGVGMRMKTLVLTVGRCWRFRRLWEIMVHFTVLAILILVLLLVITSPHQHRDCYAFKP